MVNLFNLWLWMFTIKQTNMKQFITIIVIFILSACSMSPAPTQEELEKIFNSEPRIAVEQVIIVQDTTKKEETKKETKKEEIKEIKEEYVTQQKNIMKQIDKLEDQQVILDSLLKAKEKK